MATDESGTNTVGQEESDEAVIATVGLFDEMDEPTRAEVFASLAEKYCFDCGSDLPEDPEDDCPCQELLAEDEDEDGGDDGDPDEEDPDADA